MHNAKIIILGILAAVILPTMAWLPLHERSESAVDLGALESMDYFYQRMGFDQSTTWDEIVEWETHHDDATAPVNVETMSTTSGANTMTIKESQSTNTCSPSDRKGYQRLECLRDIYIPTRDEWWAEAGSLEIWYTPGYLSNYTDIIAGLLINGSSVYRGISGGGLGCPPPPSKCSGSRSLATGSGKQFTFSVPTKVDLGEHHDINMKFHTNYTYDDSSGLLHYQGTGASLSSKDGTSDYTLAIHATPLTKSKTTASIVCVSSLIRWYINRASEKNRFRCALIDNGADWAAALYVDINHHQGNNGQHGSCCEK